MCLSLLVISFSIEISRACTKVLVKKEKERSASKCRNIDVVGKRNWTRKNRNEMRYYFDDCIVNRHTTIHFFGLSFRSWSVKHNLKCLSRSVAFTRCLFVEGRTFSRDVVLFLSSIRGFPRYCAPLLLLYVARDLLLNGITLLSLIFSSFPVYLKLVARYSATFNQIYFLYFPFAKGSQRSFSFSFSFSSSCWFPLPLSCLIGQNTRVILFETQLKNTFQL